MKDFDMAISQDRHCLAMMHHRCNTATPWRVEVRFEAYCQKKTRLSNGGCFYIFHRQMTNVVYSATLEELTSASESASHHQWLLKSIICNGRGIRKKVFTSCVLEYVDNHVFQLYLAYNDILS